jgi:hypothetical protein
MRAVYGYGYNIFEAAASSNYGGERSEDTYTEGVTLIVITRIQGRRTDRRNYAYDTS